MILNSSTAAPSRTRSCAAGPAPRSVVVDLRVHRDGQQLPVGVQRSRQFLDQPREVRVILGGQVLVVEIQAVVAVLFDQAGQILHVPGALGRGVDDGGDRIAAEAGVLDRRHDPQARRARVAASACGLCRPPTIWPSGVSWCQTKLTSSINPALSASVFCSGKPAYGAQIVTSGWRGIGAPVAVGSAAGADAAGGCWRGVGAGVASARMGAVSGCASPAQAMSSVAASSKVKVDRQTRGTVIVHCTTRSIHVAAVATPPRLANSACRAAARAR